MSSLIEHIRLTDNSSQTPVILHVPHASRFVPLDHRDDFVVPDAEIEGELDRMTDHYTDELVEGLAGASVIASGLSRFVVDVERFPDERETQAMPICWRRRRQTFL